MKPLALFTGLLFSQVQYIVFWIVIFVANWETAWLIDKNYMPLQTENRKLYKHRTENHQILLNLEVREIRVS